MTSPPAACRGWSWIARSSFTWTTGSCHGSRSRCSRSRRTPGPSCCAGCPATSATCSASPAASRSSAAGRRPPTCWMPRAPRRAPRNSPPGRPRPESVSVRHDPVLVSEALAFIAPRPGLFLDATVGDGGHAEALLDAAGGLRLLANDRDPDALAASRARLARFGGRVTFVHGTFRDLPDAHAGLGAERFAGALFDLGLSSRQIDEPARGMSYMHDGPLDLRMDTSRGETLAERLGAVTEDE